MTVAVKTRRKRSDKTKTIHHGVSAVRVRSPFLSASKRIIDARNAWAEIRASQREREGEKKKRGAKRSRKRRGGATFSLSRSTEIRLTGIATLGLIDQNLWARKISHAT